MSTYLNLCGTDKGKNRKMEGSNLKKLRGVRQTHWGPWVSEIRRPILKKRVWLGTFGSAEEAARAYDQAAVIMCGRNAKTNFPLSQSQPNHKESLSQILHSKLQKPTKASSPSLTCLRLDNERSLIGVWQKRGGSRSESKWVMILKLGSNQEGKVMPWSTSGGLVGGLVHEHHVN